MHHDQRKPVQNRSRWLYESNSPQGYSVSFFRAHNDRRGINQSSSGKKIAVDSMPTVSSFS